MSWHIRCMVHLQGTQHTCNPGVLNVMSKSAMCSACGRKTCRTRTRISVCLPVSARFLCCFLAVSFSFQFCNLSLEKKGQVLVDRFWCYLTPNHVVSKTAEKGKKRMITYHLHIVLHFCTQSWASRLLAASCSRFFFGPCSQHNCAICAKVTNNGPLPKGTRENESKIVKIHQNMLIHFVSFWRIQTIHCIHFQHLPTSTRRFVQTNQTIGDIGRQETEPWHGPHRRWCGSWSSCLTCPKKLGNRLLKNLKIHGWHGLNDYMVTHGLTLVSIML